MNFIFMKYEEYKKDDYDGVKTHDYKGNIKIFYTGDVVKDFIIARDYLYANGHTIVLSSTVDNFIADNDPKYGFDIEKFEIIRN